MSLTSATSHRASPPPHVHPSRHTAVFGSTHPAPSSQKRKREIPDDGSTPSNAAASSGKRRGLSSQVRSLERMLNHAGSADMRPDVRREKERELATKKAELGEVRMKKERGVMVGRYHMVRFFERKRATRMLKKAKKELEALGADNGGRENEERIQSAERRLHDAEVDLNYTQYAPLLEKYKGLYPKSERTAKEEGSENNEEDGKHVIKEDDSHDHGGTAGVAHEPTITGEEHANASARYGTTWRLIETVMRSGEKGALERIQEWRPSISQAGILPDHRNESQMTSKASFDKPRNGKARARKEKGETLKKAKVEGIANKVKVVETVGRNRRERRAKKEQEAFNKDRDSGSDGGFFEE